MTATHEPVARAGGYAASPEGDAPTVLSCVECGYDLRGLPAEGRCPECGTPVETSRRRPLLRHADPHYVRTLALAAAVCLLALLIDALMLSVLAAWRVYRGPLGVAALLTLLSISRWSVAALHTTSTVLITTRESPDAPAEWLRRLLPPVTAAYYATALAFEYFIDLPRPAARLVSAGLLYAGLIVISMETAWYRRLASRLPRRGVRTLLTVGLWGIPLLHVVWLIGIFVLLLRATGVGPEAHTGVKVSLSMWAVMQDALSVRMPDQAAIGLRLWRALMILACLLTLLRAWREARTLRGAGQR